VDANGTRYHLLLGYDDWSSCSDGWMRLRLAWAADDYISGLAWDSARAELTLQPRIYQFLAAPKDVAPSIENRRGAACDRYGNWYWIDTTERIIRVRSTGTGNASDFWSPSIQKACEPSRQAGLFQPLEAEPETGLQFRGLAVTEHHYLVVGVLNPKAGLLLFDLHAGGEPGRIVWPSQIPFEPYDIVAARGGGVLVLDRAHKRFWALDRQFNVIRQDQQETELTPGGKDLFQPEDQSFERRTEPRTFPSGIRLADSQGTEASDPIAIEAVPDGSALVLDRNPDEPSSKIYHYRFGQRLNEFVLLEHLSPLVETGSDMTLTAHDFTFVPEHEEAGARVPNRVYVVAASGNQSFAFELPNLPERDEERPRDYLPMRLFGGKALVAAGNEVFYDFEERWIPLIEQRRPRYAPSATLYSPLKDGTNYDDDYDKEHPSRHAFDGREPDCVWHRLMIDACLPPETELHVWSRAANEERELSLIEWQPEPRPYLRGNGSEIPFARAKAVGEGDGTWELLFQNARGRFLQLKLELKGNGRTTPRLRALRAYYPRFSYLDHYLPAIYAQDSQSASFLERFLANVEGIHTALEDRIAAAQMLFDVRSAPAETLDWLADWFGVALDPTWDETRQRLFIKHAMSFFQYRGTIKGLTMGLRLALDDCPDEMIFSEQQTSDARANGVRVVEKFLTRSRPAVVLGDPTGANGAQTNGRTAVAGRWQPTQGGEQLRLRYNEALKQHLGERKSYSFPVTYPGGRRLPVWREVALESLGFVPGAADEDQRRWQIFLAQKYLSVAALNQAHRMAWRKFRRVRLPADVPTGSVLLQDWREFTSVYAPRARAVERQRWQDFLARRYRNIAALNQAYGTNWPSFEMVSLHGRLPADGAPLRDWYQFEGIVKQMWEKAHRFTVLLPVRQSERDSSAQDRRIELAQRIINLEKPAHTIFDIKFYWALFRIGAARLGSDTLVDLGSRAPQLMSPMMLGKGHLVETYIAPSYPQDVADRRTLGFERLGG
jgi:phage tail-like protein